MQRSVMKSNQLKDYYFKQAIETQFMCRCHELPESWKIDYIMSRRGVGVAYGYTIMQPENYSQYFAEHNVFIDRLDFITGLKIRRVFGGAGANGLPFIVLLNLRDGNYSYRVRDDVLVAGMSDDLSIELPFKDFKLFKV